MYNACRRKRVVRMLNVLPKKTLHEIQTRVCVLVEVLMNLTDPRTAMPRLLISNTKLQLLRSDHHPALEFPA